MHNEERVNRILAVTAMAILLVYMLYTLYTNFQEEKRRAKESAARLHDYFEESEMYHEQANYYRAIAERPHPRVVFRYPWEKPSKFRIEG